MKHTWLAWAAKAGLPSGARRLLGYHTTPKDRSRLDHSKDELAAPLRALEKLRQAIATGRFNPDLTRAGMWEAEADPRAEPPPAPDASTAPGPGPPPALEDGEPGASPSLSESRLSGSDTEES